MNEGDKAQVAQRLAVQQAVSRVLLESNSLDEAMSEVLRLVATHLGWSLAVYWTATDAVGGPPRLQCRELWADETVFRAPIVEATRTASLRAGEELPGQVLGTREPVWVEALSPEGASPRILAACAAGLVSSAAFPLRERDTVPGVIELFARDRRAADDGSLNLMTAISHQVALVRRRFEAQAAALQGLERTRDELETVLRALPDAIAVRDAAGRVVYANEAAPEAGRLLAELQHASAADLAAKYKMWDEAGRPVDAQDLPGARAARGESEDRQLRVRRVGSSDGGDQWVAVKATPVAGVAGGSRRVVTVLRDVTVERRQQEWTRVLAEAGSALLATAELTPALEDVATLACRSIAGRCAVALKHGGGELRLAAFARSGGVASPPDDPARADAVRAASAVVQAGEATLVQEGARSRISVPLAWRGTVFGALVLEGGDDGRRLGQVDLAGAEELARRLALAVENIRLRSEGQEAARSREDLLAIVSHDLRNPLGVVMASSALLLKSPLTDPPGKEGRSKRQVEAIQRAGTRMNRLIRDLLDFAAIQSGRLTISSHPRGVGELTREVFDALAAQAEAKSLKLVDGSPESTLRVSCDHDRVIQLLDNVVGNAVKFSGEGGTVTVTAEPDGDMVRFAVTDEGPGISAEELPHVFDRYYQAKRRNRDGIGIGLSIARGIVEAHGGRIWVESPAAPSAVGTRFFFTLPAAQQ
jgi:signal transduction histidine kinase